MAKKKVVVLYDYQRISSETGVPASRLRVMYHRGSLPQEDYRLGQSPGWLESTIRPWIESHCRRGGDAPQVGTPAGS